MLLAVLFAIVPTVQVGFTMLAREESIGKMIENARQDVRKGPHAGHHTSPCAARGLLPGPRRTTMESPQPTMEDSMNDTPVRALTLIDEMLLEQEYLRVIVSELLRKASPMTLARVRLGIVRTEERQAATFRALQREESARGTASQIASGWMAILQQIENGRPQPPTPSDE